jgi:DNA processing protein
VTRGPSATARLASQVAATGTDPGALLAVLGWVVRPRRTAAELRRRCLSDGADTAALAIRLAEAAGPPDRATLDALAPVLATWRERRVTVSLVGDASYPGRLAAGWPDDEAPLFLASRGGHPDGTATSSGRDAPAEGSVGGTPPTVAFVGARRASSYGTGVTAWLAAAVARAGVRVVSGGAVGIDAAAHGAAADETGATTVVLGCGHGVAYPRPHAAPGGLFDRVVAGGGAIVSELLPDWPPRAGTVRSRNRIVARLSDVVVVVEGGERSGALLTATAAAERGIPVLAVPGDVRAPGSVAPHRLLAEGAAPCTGPGDVLELLPGPAAPTGAPEPVDGAVAVAGTTGLPPEVHAALAAAWPRALPLDELAGRSGCPLPALLGAVTRAQVAGTLAEGADGVRLRRAPT